MSFIQWCPFRALAVAGVKGLIQDGVLTLLILKFTDHSAQAADLEVS